MGGGGGGWCHTGRAGATRGVATEAYSAAVGSCRDRALWACRRKAAGLSEIASRIHTSPHSDFERHQPCLAITACYTRRTGPAASSMRNTFSPTAASSVENHTNVPLHPAHPPASGTPLTQYLKANH
jgi:hypothetical protein